MEENAPISGTFSSTKPFSSALFAATAVHITVISWQTGGRSQLAGKLTGNTDNWRPHKDGLALLVAKRRGRQSALPRHLPRHRNPQQVANSAHELRPPDAVARFTDMSG